MSRAWAETGYVVAVGIGLVLGFLSAWFDSLPIDTPLIVLVAMANAVGPWLIGMQQVLFGRVSSGVALSLCPTSHNISLGKCYLSSPGHRLFVWRAKRPSNHGASANQGLRRSSGSCAEPK